MAKIAKLDSQNPEEDFQKQLQALMDTPDEADEAGQDQAEEAEESAEDEEPDEEQDSEEAEEEAPEEEAEEEEAAPAAKPKSKAESAIVLLKRKLKASQDKIAELEQGQIAKEAEKNRTALEQKYQKAGYDADTAKYMAARDTEMAEIKAQLASTNFRADHAELLAQYPEAKAKIGTIIRNMQLTGMTAEQVCHGMFFKGESPREERNRKAVTGQLEPKPSSNGLSQAARTESQPARDVALTAKDVAGKQKYEELFGKISNKRYLELKTKYNL